MHGLELVHANVVRLKLLRLSVRLLRLLLNRKDGSGLFYIIGRLRRYGTLVYSLLL